MTVTMVRPATFATPVPQKPVGTLLDVATVIEGIAWLDPAGMFESYNCLGAHARRVNCVHDGVPVFSGGQGAETPKDFESPSWADGMEFGVYVGIQCKGPGFDLDAALGSARDVFDAAESRGVESAVMNNMLKNGTDLTPAGGAVTPQQGLGLLEGAAGLGYAGVPTLHIARTVASQLTGMGMLVREGDGLRTVLGSKVAAGSGYEGDDNLGPGSSFPWTDGELWLYASGEVVVGRGEAIAQRAVDQSTNDMYALVERPYTVALDCFMAAVRVKAVG